MATVLGTIFTLIGLLALAAAWLGGAQTVYQQQAFIQMAIALFLLVVVICVFRCWETLEEIRDELRGGKPK